MGPDLRSLVDLQEHVALSLSVFEHQGVYVQRAAGYGARGGRNSTALWTTRDLYPIFTAFSSAFTTMSGGYPVMVCSDEQLVKSHLPRIGGSTVRVESST